MPRAGRMRTIADADPATAPTSPDVRSDHGPAGHIEVLLCLGAQALHTSYLDGTSSDSQGYKSLLLRRPSSMSLVTIILILLILGAFGGGFYGGPTYRNGGFGLGGILIVVLIVLLVTGRL